MRVRLVTVSNKQPRWVLEGCAEYERRMPRAWQFEVVEVKPAARTSGVTPAQAQREEAVRIRRALPKGAVVVALDQRGASWSTEDLSAQLERWQQGGRDLAFVIGGADGLDAELQREADQRLALSAMVMPHGLARVVVVEQLYRAATVLEGHPYHK